MKRWIVAGAMLASAASAAPQDVFDKPIDKAVVTLPRDPANPQARPKRTCAYYPGFVVKEVDLGEKGADELSITPVHSGKPPCTEKIKGESVIKGDEWSGYFLGAKGPFIFFTAADGINNGMPFAVYSSENGKKLFQDSLKLDETFQSVHLIQGELVMRYRRVYSAPCSLYADTKGCWAGIRAATSLPQSAQPDCRKPYKDEMTRTPKFAADISKARSVIAYEAEARYAAGKLGVKPLPGAAACWIED